MTTPLDEMSRMWEAITALKEERVTYRAATVMAADTAAATLDLAVEGAEDRLIDFSWPAKHLPDVGDTVRLQMMGPTPLPQVETIGENAVTDRELHPAITEAITVALDTANGKNKVTYSELAPVSGVDVGTTVGDIWFKRQTGTGVINGSWQWDGDSWEPTTFGDEVLSSLTVGKVVSGTGVFDMLFAGSMYSATAGTRWAIDAAGIRLYNGSTLSIDFNALTGIGTLRSVILEGALFRTQGSGQRLQIESGGTAGGRTLTFYPAGAGLPATVYSRDDAAGNAGISLAAGGTDAGFLNFTSTFADIGYQKAGAAASFIRFDDNATYPVQIGVEAGKGMSIASPDGVDFYSGATLFARVSATDGLERVAKFSLSGIGGSAFSFGLTAGSNDADVYALRFVSTNPGATGGFIYVSDERLKRNIRPAVFDALAQVLATPIHEFEWRETGQTSMGFVAQEMPAAARVQLDEPLAGIDNPMGVASEQALAVMWKGLQQLNAKVEARLRGPL